MFYNTYQILPLSNYVYCFCTNVIFDKQHIKAITKKGTQDIIMFIYVQYI